MTAERTAKAAQLPRRRQQGKRQTSAEAEKLSRDQAFVIPAAEKKAQQKKWSNKSRPDSFLIPVTRQEELLGNDGVSR